ncbi:hypothetical protein AgCh_030607 [Apium graveolens]
MNSMMIGGDKETRISDVHPGNASSLSMLADLAVELGNNIFDDEKVEEITRMKKHKDKKDNKTQLLMVDKPTNIVLVINMKKDRKFCDGLNFRGARVLDRNVVTEKNFSMGCFCVGKEWRNGDGYEEK